MEETRPKPCSFLLMEGNSPAKLRSLPNLLCESRRFCTLPCGLCHQFRVGMYHQTAFLTVNERVFPILLSGDRKHSITAIFCNYINTQKYQFSLGSRQCYSLQPFPTAWMRSPASDSCCSHQANLLAARRAPQSLPTAWQLISSAHPDCSP